MGISKAQLLQAVALIKEYEAEQHTKLQTEVTSRTSTDLLYASEVYAYSLTDGITGAVGDHSFTDGYGIEEYQSIVVELEIASAENGMSVYGVNSITIPNRVATLSQASTGGSVVFPFRLTTPVIGYNADGRCYPKGNVEIIGYLTDGSLTVDHYKVTSETGDMPGHNARIRVYGYNHLTELELPPPELARVEIIGEMSSDNSTLFEWPGSPGHTFQHIAKNATIRITLNRTAKIHGAVLNIETLGIDPITIDTTDSRITQAGSVIDINGFDISLLDMSNNVATLEYNGHTSSYNMVLEDYPAKSPVWIKQVKIIDNTGATAKPEKLTDYTVHLEFNTSVDLSMVKYLELTAVGISDDHTEYNSDTVSIRKMLYNDDLYNSGVVTELDVRMNDDLPFKRLCNYIIRDDEKTVWNLNAQIKFLHVDSDGVGTGNPFFGHANVFTSVDYLKGFVTEDSIPQYNG